MNKKYLLTLSVLALLAGCDDGASSPGEPIDPCSACLPNQTCDNGVCKDNPDPNDPCAKCDPQYEECINEKCEPKRPSDDPCSACTDEEICIEKECKPKADAECNPACGEGKTCVDGRCAICIGTNCFFESDDGNKFCDTDDECDEGQRCFEGECQNIEAEVCDPECTDGQVCINGTCQNNTLLWSLCRSGSDCGVGECLFNVTPSKVIHLEINGESVEYSPDKPIPVRLLDERINPENYNLTHTSQAESTEDIGICSYDCTKEENSICPSGWSCQVVAKGILDYPDSSQLPMYLPEESLRDTPFAAICRRDMNEELQKDISYGIEFCNSDEQKCAEAGMIFYDGMCLEPCESSAERCPYFFSCQSVETGSGSAMACVPNAGTCTECYDHDKDGAGYGHCSNKGIDCDDANPNAYYQKPLVCNDIVDNNGDEIQTDLNCNGIIDKFELVGTLDNCGSCGSACAKPQTSNITVSCDPANAADYDPNWRVSATMATEIPEFTCVEKCSFGYGDCKGDATCNVALLTPDARSDAKNSENVMIATSDVIVNDNQGKIYALDRDGDGFPTIDIVDTQAPDNPSDRKLILDANNSVICCASNEKYCYSANKDWTSIPLSATNQTIENEDGSKTILKYASPEISNASSSYDIDDNDKAINPAAPEICDGKDNDGSTLLARETAMPCDQWCKENADTCTTLAIAVTSGATTTYKINAFCDATEDGIHQDGKHDSTGWNDIGAEKPLYFGETCNRRSNKGDICNTGTVTCESDPVVLCPAGSDHCSCGVDSSKHAFRITDANTTIGEGGTPTYNPKSSDYVKEVITSGGEVQAINCLCDGSLCTEGDCTGKDSANCYAACSHSCTLQADYALTCTVTDEGSESDGLVGGKPVFDGIDNDCDGRVDEDAMIPCIINVNAPSEALEAGVESSAFTPYPKADGYKLPQNNDNSINLCRIGILQGKKTIVDNKVTFTQICVPLYHPRDYDFYGDGFDSNCDGVDYDTVNTVFVENGDQGASLGNDDYTCRFTTGLDYVTPCSSIQGAIAKAKNEAGTFYDDILITTGKDYVIDTDLQLKGSDQLTVSAIEIPTIVKQDSKTKHYYYSGAGLPDETDHVQDGHIISAYKLHELLVKAKRSKSSFDPNKYLFSYEVNTPFSVIVNSKLETKYEYAPATYQAEMPQPEEVIRIYGGFSRSLNGAFRLPSEHDLWSRSGDSMTTVQWKPAITQNKDSYYNTYVLMQPSSSNALSLKLDSLDLKMDPAGSLPLGLVDGATFVGINGMVGAKLLNLINVKLTINAPDGYSYGKNDFPKSTAASGDNGSDSWFQENRSGRDSSYVNKFNDNTCQTHGKTCGARLGFKIENGETKDDRIAQNWGGCGGHAWTTKNYNTNNSLASDDGRQGYHGRKGAGATSKGGKGGTSDGMGGGSDWWCPKLTDHKSAQGQNGEGGAPGKNGDSSKTTMKFELSTSTPNSIYVSSDRRFAKGHYGEPGRGGGGGAVYQCWEGNGSNDSRCYAASGGMGGCGGEGGQAGGTGGSAIGIAVRSTSNVANSTQILMDENTMVTTKNGNGGTPQAGASGAGGGKGGYWYAYARCSGTAAVCSDTQDEGMGGGGSGGGGGAGGDGGGGVAGWTYPFVFTCQANVSNFTESDPLTLSNCGYSLPAEFVLVTSTRGKQETSGTRFKDIVYSEESTESKRGKQRQAVSNYTGSFHNLGNISLRWSRSSPYDGQNCGGGDVYKDGNLVASYRVPGGSGGSALSVSSTDTVKDTSCLKDGKNAIIVKTIKE